MKRRNLLKGALALPLFPVALEAAEQPLTCEVSSRMGVYRVIVRGVDTLDKLKEAITKLHERLRMLEDDHPFAEEEWRSLLFIDPALFAGWTLPTADKPPKPGYSQVTYTFTPSRSKGEIEFRVFPASMGARAARDDFFD
jgi:hypothetical protein